MYNFPYVRIVEFEISADELDHLLFLNFNNDLPDKGLRPVFQGALQLANSFNNSASPLEHISSGMQLTLEAVQKRIVGREGECEK
jgi:hypothetical protein